MGEDDSEGENHRKRPALSNISNRSTTPKGLLIIKGQPRPHCKDGEDRQVNNKHKLCGSKRSINNEANIKSKKVRISESKEKKMKEKRNFESSNSNSNIHPLQDNVHTGRVTSDLVQSNRVQKDVNEVCADGLVLSQEGSSQMKKSSTNMQTNMDMIADCHCPLCLKASYIWWDLLYQDFKDRKTEIEKGRKQANMLVQRYSSSQGIGVEHSPDSCSKLESDLMLQWKFLFQSMENILSSEATQLESSLLELKDLREHFRKEMKEINPRTSTKD